MGNGFDCPKRGTRTKLQQKEQIQIKIKPTPGMREWVLSVSVIFLYQYRRPLESRTAVETVAGEHGLLLWYRTHNSWSYNTVKEKYGCLWKAPDSNFQVQDCEPKMRRRRDSSRRTNFTDCE